MDEEFLSKVWYFKSFKIKTRNFIQLWHFCSISFVLKLILLLSWENCEILKVKIDCYTFFYSCWKISDSFHSHVWFDFTFKTFVKLIRINVKIVLILKFIFYFYKQVMILQVGFFKRKHSFVKKTMNLIFFLFNKAKKYLSN